MLDKHFQPADTEENRYKAWEFQGCFTADPASGNPPHVVMMPPPNVTGSLHIGHALTMTLQDVLTRYKRMRGFDALWQPGTDHAGIATQLVVERQLNAEGKHRSDFSRDDFIAKVWEWKEQSGGTIMRQLRRLGASADFARERFTMDDGLSQAVRKVFVDLYKQGLIYKDKRLVNWDPKFQSAISDLEVVHKDVKGKLYHVKYPLEDGSDFVTIATTRPETILADGAIAVHPDDDRYTHLVGKFVVVPVCNRIIPIIADTYVKNDFGSGAVKITAAHDYNDFEVYKRHKDKGIPLITLMNPDGTMNENCPDAYVGLDRFAAREKILTDLEELEYLVKVEDHTHSVPYGDRSGVVVEPYLTEQWYCDAATLAKPALEAVKSGRTRFVPQSWENTYFQWMDNIQPWCISRQLWWGHQIPAWYDDDGTVYVANTEAEAQEMAGPSVRLTRDPDVLDTWFSSALWPFSTLGWPDKTPDLKKYYPGDVLITGFDIIFFWVARMMMMSLHFMKDVPFRTIYIHGLVRDGQGQKMSKTKGNVADPLDIIDEYGADALRFALCALTQQGRDVKLSGDRVESYRNFVTKLWNASRFAEMQGCALQETIDAAALRDPLNRWIVGMLADTAHTTQTALDDYRFSDAAMTLYHFVWGTLCDWYIELVKPIVTDPAHPAATETRATLGWVLGQVYLLLNPFMPFVTEELRDGISASEDTKRGPLMMEPWPDLSALPRDAVAETHISQLIAIISAIRSLRADMNVPAAAKIDLQMHCGDPAMLGALTGATDLLIRLARLSSVHVTDSFDKGAVQSVVGPVTLALPIAHLIDLDKERERLTKEIARLHGEIQKIDQKLANDDFVRNAPPDIITEQQTRKAEWSSTADKLARALTQLRAA